MAAILSPGAEETPLMPCRARCARWRCRGVCFDDWLAPLILVVLELSPTGELSGGVILRGWPTWIGGMAKRAVDAEEALRCSDCSYDEDA